MTDINKFIRDETLAARDPEGHLFGLARWSEETAEAAAAAEGITMTRRHWEVVRWLRERHREQGPARTGRELLNAMEERFASGGGKRELYRLFPRGPVTQASHIAGLPLPAYSNDPSFGSVE